MKRILFAGTALLALATAAGAAENGTANPTAQPPSATAPAGTTPQLPQTAAGQMLASKVIGQSVYSGTGADAQTIGQVNDLTLSGDGKIDKAIIGIGGFLGAGQKNIAVRFQDIQWAIKDGALVAVVAMSKDELDQAPAVDLSTYQVAQPAGQPLMPATASNGNGAAPADSKAPDTGVRPPVPGMAAAPSDNSAGQNAPPDQNAPANQATMASPTESTLQGVAADSLTTGQLDKVAVFSADDQNVGSVSDVVVSQDGKIDAIVVDVGGFLGIGSKPVAISFDALRIRKDQNNTFYVFTDLTKAQLDAAPQFNAG